MLRLRLFVVTDTDLYLKQPQLKTQQIAFLCFQNAFLCCSTPRWQLSGCQWCTLHTGDSELRTLACTDTGWMIEIQNKEAAVQSVALSTAAVWMLGPIMHFVVTSTLSSSSSRWEGAHLNGAQLDADNVFRLFRLCPLISETTAGGLAVCYAI